jgi:hypothetical protein
MTRSWLGRAALIVSNTCLVVSGRLKMMKMMGGVVVTVTSLRRLGGVSVESE